MLSDAADRLRREGRCAADGLRDHAAGAVADLAALRSTLPPGSVELGDRLELLAARLEQVGAELAAELEGGIDALADEVDAPRFAASAPPLPSAGGAASPSGEPPGEESSAAGDGRDGDGDPAAANADGWVRLLPPPDDQDGDGDRAAANAGGWKQVLPLVDPEGGAGAPPTPENEDQPEGSGDEPPAAPAGQTPPPATQPPPGAPRSHLEPGPEDHDEAAARKWLEDLEAATVMVKEGEGEGGDRVQRDVLGYHSLARHRPGLGQEAHWRSLAEAVRPDGHTQHRAPSASTEFESHVLQVRSYKAALAACLRRVGIPDEFTQPAIPVPAEFVVEHGTAIDSGLRPREGLTRVAKRFEGATRRVFPTDEVAPTTTASPADSPVPFEAFDGVTRVRAKLLWCEPKDSKHPSRWMLIQHYPDEKGWDDAAKRYGPPRPNTPEIIDGPLHRGGKA